MGGPLLFDKNKIRKRAEDERERERRARSEKRRRERKPRKAPVVGRIPEDFLRKAYLSDKKSMREIATMCACSVHKVAYWITAYSIPIRNQSEAVYLAHNKATDPFSSHEKDINTKNINFLYGIGLGLYWGTGSKTTNDIQIGSNDVRTLYLFIQFLRAIYGINKESLRFRLRISSSINTNNTILFWAKALSVSPTQFQKTIIITSQKKKTYEDTDMHGFVTLYFYNAKFKKLLLNDIKKYAK